MFSYGLKLWSTNTNYLAPAIELYNKGIFAYIELYIIPDSYDKYINYWLDLNIPFCIHCPHYSHGFNLAKNDNLNHNLKLFKEVQKYADTLNANKIVLHPGTDGDIRETSRQLNILGETRIHIENKPFLNHDGKKCNGATYEDIAYLINTNKVNFCLDFGHAICSANSQKKNPLEYCLQLLKFKPEIIHISDGIFNSETDQHLHFCKGNYPLDKIISYVPNTVPITIETEKNYTDKLNDFADDVIYISSL